jgi:hypothetical protein
MAQGMPAFGWWGGSPYGTRPQTAEWTVEEEKAALKGEIEFLKTPVESCEKRMEELEKEEA